MTLWRTDNIQNGVKRIYLFPAIRDKGGGQDLFAWQAILYFFLRDRQIFGDTVI